MNTLAKPPPEAEFLALEFGGTKLQAVAGARGGVILRRVDLRAEGEKGAEGLLAQFEEVLQAWGGHPWRAAGIGFGGPVRRSEGRIHRSIHVRGWSDFPLADWLKERIGAVPVVLENDTNAGAYAEALAGAGKGRRHVFYTNSGSGVGGGLVVDGQIYHGADPSEMEFGHLRLDRSGMIVEDRCSGWAVDRALRAHALARPESAMGRLVGGQPAGGEARSLLAALAAGDEGAEAVLREAAEWLGFALSHVVHLAHPEVIVLGGGLSGLGEAWRTRVEAALAPWIMEALRPAPEICLSALGTDVVPVGALLLAETSVRNDADF